MPETAASVLALVLLILPGLVYESTVRRQRPQARRTTFEEISTVVLVGFAASAVAALLAVLTGLIVPAFWVDVSSWIEQPDRYWQEEYALVVRSTAILVLTGVALSILLARVGATRRVRVMSEAVLGEMSNSTLGAIWHVFRPGKAPGGASFPRDVVVMAAVRTVDSSLIMGQVAVYDLDDDASPSPLLALHSPIKILRPGMEPNQMAGEWPIIVIPFNRISEIAVRYVIPQPDPAAPRGL